MTKEEILLRPFKPADQDTVKELILAGLGEHFEQINPIFNPDLNNISESYADALFIVAQDAERIIGTGALVQRGPDCGEIVRMSVASDKRRHGIGTQILRQLCDEGRARGYTQIILETTATWTEVIEFYKRFGFRITHEVEGEYGRELYFALELTQ
ncbi:MAG: GNAT family N-acetyltransferase [Chloroflexota bacterium]